MWLLLKMFAPLKSGGHTKFRREKQKKLNDCGKNCCVYGVNCARDVRSLMFFSFRSHAITKTMTITITAIGFHLAKIRGEEKKTAQFSSVQEEENKKHLICWSFWCIHVSISAHTCIL